MNRNFKSFLEVGLPVVAVVLVVFLMFSLSGSSLPVAAEANLNVTFELVTGATIGDEGTLTAATSPNGRYIAFSSDSTNLVEYPPVVDAPRDDVYILDVFTGSYEMVSQALSGNSDSNGTSFPIGVTDTGLVTFLSDSSDLVLGDTNSVRDVFQWRAGSGVTRVVFTKSGAQLSSRVKSADVSADGRMIAYVSEATVVPGDTNGYEDVFIVDTWSGPGSTYRVQNGSVQPNSLSSTPKLDATGENLVFSSFATNLASDPNGTYEDVFLFELSSKNITKVSPGLDGNGNAVGSWWPEISPNGLFVTFTQDDTVSGYHQVSWYSVVSGTYKIISTDYWGNSSNNNNGDYGSSVSDFGSVVYSSLASDLVPGISGFEWRTYIWFSAISENFLLLSFDTTRFQYAGDSVLFTTSQALVPEDTNGVEDVYRMTITLVDSPTPTPSPTPTVEPTVPPAFKVFLPLVGK